MKNVRLFYTKKGRMRFVSHLDMTRFAARIIKKAGLPVWYTEGFNPRPYITFALPLSLGFESEREIMDIRLTDDDYPLDGICDALNAVCPEYIHFFEAAEPEQKVGNIAYASFDITFDDAGAIEEPLSKFLKRDRIVCVKKTKKGVEKEIDIAPKIKSCSIESAGDTVLHTVLPAGSEDNLNPELLITAFFEQSDCNYYCYSVVRNAVLNRELQLFK